MQKGSERNPTNWGRIEISIYCKPCFFRDFKVYYP